MVSLSCHSSLISIISSEVRNSPVQWHWYLSASKETFDPFKIKKSNSFGKFYLLINTCLLVLIIWVPCFSINQVSCYAVLLRTDAWDFCLKYKHNVSILPDSWKFSLWTVLSKSCVSRSEHTHPAFFTTCEVLSRPPWLQLGLLLTALSHELRRRQYAVSAALVLEQTGKHKYCYRISVSFCFVINLFLFLYSKLSKCILSMVIVRSL